MEEAPGPLILTRKASRRLQLLFRHGGRPQAAAPTTSSTAGEAAAAPEPGQLCLAAGLLGAPAPLDWLAAANGEANGSSGAGDAGAEPAWLQSRDVLSEVALHLDTFRALKVSAGAYVEVRNATQPGRPPRLARALPCQQAAPGEALLPPSLAFNLGLPLHLSQLLHTGSSGSSGSSNGSGSNGASSSSSSSRGGQDFVLLAPYLGPSAPAGSSSSSGEGGLAALSQPSTDPALVPVAESVTFSVVRTPADTLLAAARSAGAGSAGAPAPGAATDAPGGAAAAGEGSGPAAVAEEAGGRAAASNGRRAEAEGVVLALQQYLLAQPRLVCTGDVLAVPRQEPRPAAQLLPNLLQPPPLAPLGATAPSAAAGNGAGAAADNGSSGGSGSNGGNRASPQPPLPTAAPAAPAAGPAPAALPELVYFKVVRVSPEPCQGPIAVDPASTEVKLEGSCAAGLPAGLAAYLAGGADGTAAPGPASTGEAAEEVQQPPSPAEGPQPSSVPAPTWRQLAQLLASALHPQGAHLPLRLAVLLHGPAGSGRQTAVRAAAAAAGCHVVSLSCHDLRPAGVPEKKVLEGLRAAFAAAGQYRPAVLLLRHFEALGGEGGGGGSGGDASAARAGTALAECIRTGFRPPPENGIGSSGASSSGGGSGGEPGEAAAAAGAASAEAPLFPAPLVLVASVAAPDAVPAPLRRCFTHELAAEALDQAGRQDLLEAALGAAGGGQLEGEVLEELARHTAGLLPREVRAVAADAAALAAAEALPAAAVLGRGAANGAGGEPVVAAAPAVSEQHLTAALEAVRQRTATEIGAPKIPNVKWEDVGGLEDVKRAILDTVELPLKHPELFSGGLRRRSGVLLYGPPGTGKTLLAKAVATECGINFLSVKGPELINMYVGESERQIREVFARARRARPCVVFFDELDSLAPARGKGSDSGGVMDRVVAQLLAEIDGVQGGAGANDLFLIGATNRPDLLDTALLRPGRLDRLLYVGIAEDAPSRLRVLEALTRKFALGPGVDLAAVAEGCPGRFTGADMYALCSDAWMTALRRRIAAHEVRPAGAAAGAEASEGDSDGSAVVVGQADFEAALGSLQPSLSEAEIRKYEAIRDQYQARK